MMIIVSLVLSGIGAAFQHALSSSLVSSSYAEGGRRAALGLYNSSGDAGKLIFTGLLSLALGAGRRQMANSIVSRGMRMVAVGLVAGLVLSYWATNLIRQLLFGVEPTDPATFIMAALGFGMVALVACLLPAWRAMRVDPVTILQAE